MNEQMKSVTDMRQILAEEIDNLRKGKTTAANVNAIVNATGKILSSVKLEMEYNKYVGKVPEIGFIPTHKKDKALKTIDSVQANEKNGSN